MSQRPTEEELKLTVSNLRKELLALKQSENASKIELAELNQIFHTVADGVVVIDKDFNIIRVNDTYQTSGRMILIIRQKNIKYRHLSHLAMIYWTIATGSM